MTKRVLYNVTTSVVVQWQDTDMYNYADPADGMALLEITDDDYQDQETLAWVVDGHLTRTPVIIAPPVPTDEQLADAARAERSHLLRNIYDPGIMMALRALRMASTPEQTSYAQGKVSELDAYAEALLVVPDQPDFPQIITWPTAPTK